MAAATPQALPLLSPADAVADGAAPTGLPQAPFAAAISDSLTSQSDAGGAIATPNSTHSNTDGAETPLVAAPSEEEGAKVTGSRIMAASAWQHPQANRRIVLEQHALGYLLQRRRRRTVGMKIATQGLEVHAPTWVNTAEIERILQSKSGWIVRKLQEQASLRHKQQLARPQWQDGQCLPWRGGLLQLRLADPAHPANLPAAQQARASQSPARLQKLARAARLLPAVHSGSDAAHTQYPAACAPAPLATSPATAATVAAHELWLGLPANSPESLIRDCTAYWMQQQAQAIFTERMNHYAPLLGVHWRTLSLSQANTRWGSASSNGTIRLHWRLVQMPPELLDYVVVHELAHLREMNHSARFWALVEQILPDYKQRQLQLKRTALAPW